ncbi:hypothetical protein BC943DRAFT_13164 [Umbelopsis sp. AD052]|nr:hypothetical protein BC943DRAFT_13164 [Umbelopsis sp. AD052]
MATLFFGSNALSQVHWLLCAFLVFCFLRFLYKVSLSHLRTGPSYRSKSLSFLSICSYIIRSILSLNKKKSFVCFCSNFFFFVSPTVL